MTKGPSTSRAAWAKTGRRVSISAARELLTRVNEGGIVVISRGAKGAILANRDQVWQGRSPKVTVRSTIGSGDSMLGGLLWAMLDGRPLPEAFQWGLAAGAATAETDGSRLAAKADIERLFPAAEVIPI
ncbi:MAG: hypothetical protein C4320_06580 [Armatimonadota bacterium]